MTICPGMILSLRSLPAKSDRMIGIDACIRWICAALLALAPFALSGIMGCRSVVEVPMQLAELTQPDSDHAKPSASQAGTAAQFEQPNEQEILSAEKVLSATVQKVEENQLRPKRLDSRGWFLDSGTPIYLARQLHQNRWRHRSLEEMLDPSSSTHSVLEAGTHSEDPEVQATALVGLVRSGTTDRDEALADLIEDPQVAPTTKAALLEALSDSELIDDLFARREELIAAMKLEDKAAETQLRCQFWITLASSVPSVRSDERFSAYFADEPSTVQATILDLMLSDPTTEVPTPVQGRFQHLSPEVMSRIDLWHPYLRTLAPIDVLEEYIRSPEFTIRESAIIGLGREGSPSAHALLLNISDSQPSLVQAAAVTAWGLMPQHDEWPRLAKATSWRVRLAVAKWIPLTPRNQATIKKLQTDKSHQVAQAMLARTATPGVPTTEERTAPSLEVAEVEVVELSEREAVAFLKKIEQAQRDEDQAARMQARQELLLAPAKVLAAVDQAAPQLASYDNTYLFGVLLPQCDPAYQRLHEATTGSPQLTLIALRELERRSQQSELPELILWRIGHKAERFSSVDWQAIMAMIKDDDRPAASKLVRRSLASDDPVVRVSACEHVARHPIPDVTLTLEDSLQHEASAVRVAAIHALSKVDGARHIEQFISMLLDREIEVQLAAAEALDAQNDPRGIQHIQRMTYSSSREIRLRATQAIAARRSKADIPELIRLLDDDTSIRVAALDGLSQLVTAEQNPPHNDAQVSLEAKCASWKNWFDRQSLMR